VEEFRRDETPPDPAREARIREAFAVLSDPARRADYDRLLETVPVAARGWPRGAGWAAAAIGALAAIGLAWWALAPSGSPRGRPLPQIQADLSASVGSLRSVDLAGNARKLGLAFTVAEGVMATACAGIDPRAQLVVTVGRREIPARVALVDEALGICRLSVSGAGSWPIPLAAAAPPAKARVLTAGLDAAGEVALSEGQVLAVQGGLAGTVDASFGSGGALAGQPLLDIHGRVMAIALGPAPGGGFRHRLVPASWAEGTPVANAPTPATAATPGVAAGENDPHADARAARTQNP
jgi:hypothetical protein